MKNLIFFLSFIFIMFPLFEKTIADPSTSYDNNKPKSVNVDYKNGSIAAYNGKYFEAIKHLKKAESDSTNNPDVYNLLGYSHRKLGQFEKAFENYRKALKLYPRHLGANEYIGELYLQTNNLKKAKEHLEVLDEVCLFGCDEYDVLKDAIEKYKKNME